MLGVERIVLTALESLSVLVGDAVGSSDKELLPDVASGFIWQVYIVTSN